LARFSLILGTLLKNSVSIDEALIIVSGAIDSAPYQKIIQQVQLEVRQGKTLLEGIEIHDHKSKLFDPTTRAMIRVGEKTGNLSNSLLYISEYFQEEVDNITKDLATSLEPILLILIALVVGFIAISIITPMYSILNVINR
jgi:type IV pilus assembly protein PilC